MSLYSLSTNKVQHINATSFNETVLESGFPVLVDFYADWCGPCRALTPALEQFARENPDVKVVRVNIDEEPSLAMLYDVEAIPSLMVFRAGDLRAQHIGMVSRSQLKAMVKR